MTNKLYALWFNNNLLLTNNEGGQRENDINEEFEDTKESESEFVNQRTYNTMAKGKRINNDLQNNTQNTEDRLTRTPRKTGYELMLLHLDDSIKQYLHLAKDFSTAIPLISTKQMSHLSPQTLEHNKTMVYGVRNPRPVLLSCLSVLTSLSTLFHLYRGSQLYW
jgi:hypothetical protein